MNASLINKPYICLNMLFVSTGGNAQLQASLSLRVRRAMDYPEMPWQLRYIGQPELGTGKSSFMLKDKQETLLLSITPIFVDYLFPAILDIRYEAIKGSKFFA